MRRPDDEPALRLHFRYTSPAVGVAIEVASLRRPELVLRVTRYPKVIVDERVLTRSFEIVAPHGRAHAFVVLDGRVLVHLPGRTIELGPGDGFLQPASLLGVSRWERASALELEWSSPRAPVAAKLALDLAAARAVEQALLAAAPQRPTLAGGLELFRRAGVADLPDLDALAASAPTDRDRRIARAMEEQMAHLSSRATALHLGETARLSPRQLQRTIAAFNERYGVNARNWRDTRNRWRVQIAAALLSVPELTVAAIAREVGFASGNALTRAMTDAGFPPPAILREQLEE